LDDPALESCWTDDMTLGWVYQYWNDPEREALDEKLNAGGKVEPHEIASKTQMFTERYMVDWLLQNSLGPMWLTMCRKHGWIADCRQRLDPHEPAVALPEAARIEGDESSAEPPRLTGLLKVLDERRAEWRAKRECGEVSLTDLMPLQSDAERRWAYYVPQPIPADAVEHAPETVRDLKLLDPAVGSGHFLVVAFDLLFALYKEEARHRGESDQERWSDRAIVERILEHNLHGIDLDPRAVQIAAAALWLKARRACPAAHPERLNLVASDLRLASLPDDDPALMDLRREVERETGIPAELTDTVIHALKGADHLGSLLKVDAAVEEAIDKHEDDLGRQEPKQFSLLEKEANATPGSRVRIPRDLAKAGILDLLESFLARHSGGDDLGLRLRGEQLAAGVRFVRMIREGSYDLVVGNPPYQGTAKMTNAKYVEKHYALGKADLYAAFLLRGLEIVRKGGYLALVSMNGWLYLKQYSGLRAAIMSHHSLCSVVDLLWCAFEQMRHNTVAMYCVQAGLPNVVSSVGLLPTPRNEREESIPALERKRTATLCQAGFNEFNTAELRVVPEWPVVYWWDDKWLKDYSELPLVAGELGARNGLQTNDNTRFIRKPWEIASGSDPQWSFFNFDRTPMEAARKEWVPYIRGSDGRAWFDQVVDLLRWGSHGLEVKSLAQAIYGSYTRSVANEDLYFKKGVAFTTLGAMFSARVHSRASVFGNMGRSVFDVPLDRAVLSMNSKKSREVMRDLNPTVHFTTGDVNRLPLFPISDADKIFATIENAFSKHESHRETSVEFKQPGPSPWRYAQAWGQAAVDRPEGTSLPPYEPEFDAEPPTDQLSFALGVSLGRFGPNGEGIVDPAKDSLSRALTEGILFLDGTLDTNDNRDSLGQPAASILHTAWSEHGATIDARTDLRTWLRLKFFGDVHKGMYESRPIHWPLSSEKKTFVAWINIHRWNERTLRVLLADHLNPAMVRVDGELNDLRAAREGADRKAARDAEKRFDRVQRWREELAIFIAAVEECAEKGPPPTDAKCPQREVDARYDPDLDDGVMVNSAALWPLLIPQWKDPKKWWKELATAKGKKDYDWSHLAMRYWPNRVDKKCREDPSLGVAHGCFWKYHPERAWAWELRLQDEIGPDFRIEEAPYRGDGGHEAHRATFLEEHPEAALAAIEKEVLRRRRKQKQPQPELHLLETGLWSRNPEYCWELEHRIIKKQETDFSLLAPDEPESRAEFIREHPQRLAARMRLLSELEQPGGLFSNVGSCNEDTGTDEAVATESESF
jgi:hypothetical protein